MFRHRIQLRRWAARVLLLWLFGVGTAVVNACVAPKLVDPGGLPSGHATVAGVVPQHAKVTGVAPCHGSSEHHQVADTADSQNSPGRSICKDFCDKAAVSMPPLKFALDDVQGHALLRAVVP